MNRQSQNQRALIGLGAALALALTLLAGVFILVTVATTPSATTPSASPGSADATPTMDPEANPAPEPGPEPEPQESTNDSSANFGFARASRPDPSKNPANKPQSSDPHSSNSGPSEPSDTRPAQDDHPNHPKGKTYDPLGTNAKPGDLSQTDKDRLEIAVMHFAQATYGYTGDDPAEYEDGVSRVVVLPDYYESPGAKAFSAYGDSVRESGGVESSTVLKDFEITDSTKDEATGIAKLAVSDSTGETTLTQKLTLVRWGAIWRVQWADELKEDSA